MQVSFWGGLYPNYKISKQKKKKGLFRNKYKLFCNKYNLFCVKL